MLINSILNRFWAVQILFVGTPSILFMVYAMHVMTTIPVEQEKPKEDQGKDSKGSAKPTESSDSDSGKVYSVLDV